MVTATEPERATSWGARFTHLQVRRSGLFLLVAFAFTVAASFYASRLRVQTGFDSLLPASKPSVQELKRVAAVTEGVSTLFVMLQGDHDTSTRSLREAADALVPELEKLGPSWVGHAESGVHEAMRFLQPRAGLFLSKTKIDELTEEVKSSYEAAVGEATGLSLDLEESPPEKRVDVAALRNKLRIEGVDPSHYPDGYYQSRDGKLLIVLVRSPIPSGDFDRGAELIERAKEIVRRNNLPSGIRVAYSGDLATAVAEYQAINRDLTNVGITGCVLIGFVVLLYYLRVRTVFLMVLTIGVGVAWTFGATQFTVGRLNIATGFLFTIVAGNGINFGILYMARYLEARRKGISLLSALQTAQRETWIPTLTAALAAAVSYGSLSITDFRGFHDFGFIGGIGIVLCWIATFWVLPCLLALAERFFPLDAPKGTGPLSRLHHFTSGGVPFGRPFEWLVMRTPRTIAVICVALTVVGLTGSIFWIRSDPMEYDLLNLRTDASARQEEIRLNYVGHEITGHVGASGMAILVNKSEQVPELSAILESRRDAAPEAQKPFEKLHALQDFVPTDQATKIPALLQLRHWLVKARHHKGIDDSDWTQVEAYLPPEDLKPFDMHDLPEGLARAFTEKDGTRGRIVYISPTESASVDDAHYLFRWADSYREVRLPDGALIRGSGRAVIYADMWRQILQDAPRAVFLSLGATALVVLLAFRRSRASFYVLGSLLAGVSWMVGLLALLRVKINFLNFVVLPITFGIGVDYAVNIVQRYLREGPGSALLATRETGGAVTLCSLTTMFGYLALVRSNNFGVRSLGLAGFLGEVCCLLAAMLLLPSALVWLDRRRGSEPSPYASAPTQDLPVAKAWNQRKII
jgi:predicted RND superfamily exporter protein